MALSEAELQAVRAPNTIEGLGVPPGMVEDLFMRRLITEGAMSVGEVAEAVCISHRVGIELAEILRTKTMIEYLGAAGRDYVIQPTDLGHQTTVQRMTAGRHVGPVPVPLELYLTLVSAQATEASIDRGTLREAFSDLVVDNALLDQIGPAFTSGGAIFLYGPAGTGKTSLAERLNRVVQDPVLIPRYVEVDGQIISVYDPSLHNALSPQPEGVDSRWVLCERPLIVVGGELDMRMLDLYHDHISGISSAPVQMLANNGILVVDDFGRQAIRPEEILNRWIVPLSRGVDYLKSTTGSKFSVPFELKLVISTNLDPNSLGDDAFLRRLRNKIYVGPITESAFGQVLDSAAERYGVTLVEDSLELLSTVSRREIGELRPYLPVDFCELTNAISRYAGVPPVFDNEMIDYVAGLYFVQADAQLPGRQVDLWSLPVAAARQPAWNDYQIGGFGADDPMAGLDDLAMTQSIESSEHPVGVPTALQPGGMEANGAL
ncbi:MAG: AAA family ATPase [Actinomycetota bacterium]